MRPVKLEFEGINSFSEHTIIDFDKLTKGGIFGIFGDTGSGKSTILDSINFALYGKVERSKEKTDIINYRCNSAWAKFTFTIEHNGKRRTYYIERTIRKDKNSANKVFLYEDGVCIADKAQDAERKIEEVLGVDSEDFRKCIALPQGEFSQFVKSAPREKLALIERLFSLSRYGDKLKEKISARQEQVEGEFQNVSGKLSVYSEITEDGLQAAKEQLEQLTATLGGLAQKAKEADENYARKKVLFDRKTELDGAKKAFAELTSVSGEMEELRKGLSSLAMCREAVATHNSIISADQNVFKTTEAISDAEKEAEEAKIRLDGLDKAIADGEFTDKIEEYTKLSAKYQTCSGKPERLSALKKQLELKREEFKEAERKLAALSADYASSAADLAKLEKAVQSIDRDGLERFVNTEFKGAILRNEYVAMLDYFVDLSSRTRDYDDGSALYKFVQKEFKDKIEEYKQRVYDVKDFKLENVNKQFERLQNGIKEKDELSEKLRAAAAKVADIAGQIALKQKELETLKKDGVELRQRADEIYEELKAVFGDDTDYLKAERQNRLALDECKRQLKALNDKLESTKAEINELGVKRERLVSTLQALKERRIELEEKLKSDLSKAGFSDVAGCEAQCAKFAQFADAERSLKEYDERFAAMSAKIRELSSIAGIEKIDFEQVRESERLKNELDEELIKLNGDIAVVRLKIDDFTAKLAEKQELLKEFKRISKDRELVARLKEVTRNNKFLEFIANEYLYDISAMASSTLLKLTDGRYFLTYKDNNFTVGDNFDGGNLRGVNTLSGGETFLVSLSLALALSQTICARSLKSIEFFFLDEGFGTLDSSLVDTVMSALEKLKSSRFTIGIISHVEELKHRIDSKITVFKATESHGSTVQISC